jgi:hypothetical protein
VLTPQPFVQRLAVEPLHDEEAAAVGQHAEAEDVDDVAMTDAVDGARLEDEARDGAGVGLEPRRHDLDRRLLADDGVDDRVYGRHAALAELVLDAVLADHRAGRERLAHHDRPAIGARLHMMVLSAGPRRTTPKFG